MAIKLIANYAKRLGLPGYSSHQFSVSVETEVQDVSNIAAESSKLYETLQKSVDATNGLRQRRPTFYSGFHTP